MIAGASPRFVWVRRSKEAPIQHPEALILGARAWSAGFTLIEVVGVLAVVLILATMIFSATTKSVDVGVSKQESVTLQNFATALQNSVLRNRVVPDGSGWYLAVAKELGLSPNAVLYNARNPTISRVFMIDPNIQIGPSAGGLPYTQGSNGSAQPQSARAMILSSLAAFAPFPATATNSANFNALWSTPDGSLPSNSSFNGWKGLPDDLKVQRVNFGPLFVNLQLFNYQSTDQGQYQINSAGTNTVANVGGVNAYFVQNTPLDLIKGVNSGSTTDARLVLSRDSSYFYVAQVWRSVPVVPDVVQTNGAAANLANVISMAASLFVASPNNTNAAYGATPTAVLGSMADFMSAYSDYAASAASNGWTASSLWHTNASIAQGSLMTNMANLFNGIKQGGCTNGP
jgi:type II secretory pathway pseudopilin PulG